MKWLDRDTVRAPYLTLCLSEAAYLKAARHCEVPPDTWLDVNRHVALLHTWEKGGRLTCVVCLHPGGDPIEIASSLIHEAVHVFQRLCDSIGESEPSREFEAYSIERIAERLMREFVRQTSKNAKPPRALGGNL